MARLEFNVHQIEKQTGHVVFMSHDSKQGDASPDGQRDIRNVNCVTLRVVALNT